MSEIKILYQDSDILVLDKPAGITVNRSDTTKGEETVQDWIEQKIEDFSFQIKDEDRETDFYKRAGIVHRIDKETSGILLVAKKRESFEELQRQFKERLVKKTYIALVHGKVTPSEGEINVPVGRLPWDRKKFGILAGGKPAITRYKAVKEFEIDINKKKREWVSLLELNPQSGRTHQIRVHLKYFNHPIFSDFLYAGRKTSRDDRKILERVFLHANKISFSHPKTGETVSFESLLPLELSQIIERKD